MIKQQSIVMLSVFLLVFVSIIVMLKQRSNNTYMVPDSLINQRRYEKLMKIKKRVEKNMNLSPKKKVKESLENLSFPDYLKNRGFYTEKYSNELKNAYLTNVFLSSYLTYPLTIAYWLAQSYDKKNMKVAIIGAAVECEDWRLPSWIELCHVTNKSWTIEFISDFSNFKEDKVFQQLHKRLHIKRTQSKIEDMKDLSSYDAFVAFHPGIGTSYNWKDAFDKIMDQNKTVLVTAYNEMDANKDGFAFETLGYDIIYEKNKFSSLGEPNDIYNTGINEWVGNLKRISED